MERKDNKSGAVLTASILEKRGFERDEFPDDDGDPVIIWEKDGVEIYEHVHSGGFSFCTRTRPDNSFKSGIGIDTENNLENLYYALTSKEL